MHNINSVYCIGKCAEWPSVNGTFCIRLTKVPSQKFPAWHEICCHKYSFLPESTRLLGEDKKKSISVILLWRNSFGNFLLHSLFSTQGIFRFMTLRSPWLIVRLTTSRYFGSLGVMELQRISIDLLSFHSVDIIFIVVLIRDSEIDSVHIRIHLTKHTTLCRIFYHCFEFHTEDTGYQTWRSIGCYIRKRFSQISEHFFHAIVMWYRRMAYRIFP